MDERSIPNLEFLLQGMADLSKAVSFYKKKLQEENFTEQEAMVFVQSWHNYVLPKLVDNHLKNE